VQRLHSYKESELEDAAVLRRGLLGHFRSCQIFRPLAKFLRAARAFLGDFERPPFLPTSVKNARTMSIESAMW
jgi:hypothetical protein